MQLLKSLALLSATVMLFMIVELFLAWRSASDEFLNILSSTGENVKCPVCSVNVSKDWSTYVRLTRRYCGSKTQDDLDCFCMSYDKGTGFGLVLKYI